MDTPWIWAWILCKAAVFTWISDDYPSSSSAEFGIVDISILYASDNFFRFYYRHFGRDVKFESGGLKKPATSAIQVLYW